MINLLDSKLLAWISRNKATFMLVVLLVGNIYQYIDRREANSKYDARVQDLGTKLGEQSRQSIEYERKRSEELQLLLVNLSKTGK